MKAFYYTIFFSFIYSTISANTDEPFCERDTNGSLSPKLVTLRRSFVEAAPPKAPKIKPIQAFDSTMPELTLSSNLTSISLPDQTNRNEGEEGCFYLVFKKGIQQPIARVTIPREFLGESVIHYLKILRTFFPNLTHTISYQPNLVYEAK